MIRLLFAFVLLNFTVSQAQTVQFKLKMTSYNSQSTPAFKETIRNVEFQLNPMHNLPEFLYGTYRTFAVPLDQSFQLDVVGNRLAGETVVNMVFAAGYFANKDMFFNGFNLEIPINSELNGNLKVRSPYFLEANGSNSTVDMEIQEFRITE